MSSQETTTEPAKVSREALTAILWAGLAISFCFLTFRGYVRLKIFRRFFLDDIFVLSAWLIFLANVILYQVMVPTVYLLIEVYQAVDTEGLTAIPEDFPAKLDFFFHAHMSTNFLFCCCLWAVKASFLAFFRKLGHNVARQNILWWCALSITVIGFVINFAIWDYKCSVGHIPINTTCGVSDSSLRLEHAIFRTTTAFDIVSDFFILILPINLLWKVQVDARKKLVLVLVLSLTIFVIITAIVRVTVVLAQSKQLDLTWLYTWAVIEQTVAIMVACLMSYRALFVQDSSARRLPNVKDHMSQQQLRYNQYGEEIIMEQKSFQISKASNIEARDESEPSVV